VLTRSLLLTGQKICSDLNDVRVMNLTQSESKGKTVIRNTIPKQELHCSSDDFQIVATNADGIDAS